MDTMWTARFAAAGWADDLTSRITDALKQDVPAEAARENRLGLPLILMRTYQMSETVSPIVNVSSCSVLPTSSRNAVIGMFPHVCSMGVSLSM